MKYIASSAIIAATISGAFADLCSLGSVDVDGNWYCQEVNGITYTGLDGSGSYQKVTNIDPTSGTCSQTTQSYTGSMSPLDDELSFHFRGPLQLKQFAAYTPGSAPSKKLRKRNNSHRHGHSHFHNHQKEVRSIQDAVEKRQAECEMVTATINGQVESWMNNYECTPAAGSSAPATSAAASTTATSVASTTSAAVQVKQNFVAKASSSASQTSSSTSSSTSAVASGSWGQTAYYNADSQTAHGLVFLNHMGGTGGSGTWSTSFGNSLSYASSDGCSGAASPQVLSSTAIPSSAEVVIMSDNECNGDDCGATMPGSVAYHGFGGAQKAFFFEFEMPDEPSQQTGAWTGNMPAIWALNAQIPRTLQYGNPTCSCWATGCGELDIFEVLAPGDTRAKSTLHGNAPCSGGNSDYFARPTNGTITVGVLMNDNNIHIKVNPSYNWESSLASSDINDLCNSMMTQENGISLFALAA